MIKFLFFDDQELEWRRGFARELVPPEKHAGNPLLLADAPWETGGMQLYGSVLKPPDGPFQLWYHTVSDGVSFLAYAESEDGLTWRKPLSDLFPRGGQPTNLVFERAHGAAVLYDAADPRPEWRYKLVTGAPPSGCICAFRSADGRHWEAVQRGPIIGTNPDCPMGLLRATDGRYALYHRVWGHGRRLFRSESWDFVHWSAEPRLVLEPDPNDGPQIQFYGMGVAPYGPYELGTLWIYHTDPDDLQVHKMRGVQEPELAYARSGYAWHRAAQGTPFIPRGTEDAWDRGNLQCASAPVLLPEEIRYYYAGTTAHHARGWTVAPQRAGLGLATTKPDRFVALRAGTAPAELVTAAFPLPAGRVLLNAAVERDGWVRVAVLDSDGHALEGRDEAHCPPLTEDAVAHHVRWTPSSDAPPAPASGGAPPAAREALPGAATAAQPVAEPGRLVRLRVRAQRASVFSLAVADAGEETAYHRFGEPNPARTHLRV